MSMQSPEFPLPTQVAAVLFDLDGTLVHTAPDFSDVLQQLCLQAGIAAPSEQAVHATVSSGARALVKLAFDREPGDPDFEPLLTELLERYFDRIQRTQSALYPNMVLLLNHQLSFVPLGPDPLPNICSRTRNCSKQCPFSVTVKKMFHS